MGARGGILATKFRKSKTAVPGYYELGERIVNSVLKKGIWSGRATSLYMTKQMAFSLNITRHTRDTYDFSRPCNILYLLHIE